MVEPIELVKGGPAAGSDELVQALWRLARRDGWTKTALADAAGVSRYTLGRWVNGGGRPELHNFMAAAKATGYSVSYLEFEALRHRREG